MKLFRTALLTLLLAAGREVDAADIVWSGGTSGSSTIWTNVNNWTGGVAPGSGDNAVFNSTFTGNPITINLNPVTSLAIGSLTFGPASTTALLLKPQSTGPSVTTLVLNGANGILLSNYSATLPMTLVRTNAVNSNALNLSLGNSGIIYANWTGLALPGTAGSVVLSIPIGETGGSHGLTLTGPGLVYLRSTNSYTGPTIVNNGVLELDPTATIGDGTGTLYLSGGQLLTGGSSTTRIISNPIVVDTPGNAYIYNTAGTAGTRVFAFSGSLTGLNGRLVLGNANTTPNEYLDVQLLGTFTFNLPLVVGNNLGDAYSDNYPYDYAELQMANSASTGPQIYNGDISGDGPIIRGSLPGVVVSGANGTSIFTGNNSYSGGTSINNGTLFANNTAGSALGSGAVTVTNAGILAGSGFVGAPTAVYLNGTIQPGATATTPGTLSLDGGLTFNPGAQYTCLMTSATGSPGTDWGLISCGAGWTDAGNGTTLSAVNLTASGPIAGWNDAVAHSWLIISNPSGGAPGFNAANWSVNTTGFAAYNAVAGVFSLAGDDNGNVFLNYTPTSGNIVLDVPAGSVTQGGVAPVGYPELSGLNSVTKVGNGEVIMTNALNSYLGATYILAGTASAAVNSTTVGGAFGASTAPLVLGDATGTSNATLNLSQPGVVVANSILVQAGSSGIKTLSTTITDGTATNSGNITLDDSVTLSAVAGGTEVFLGNFTGDGDVTITGNGSITMAGIGSYTGLTTLAGGTLNLAAKALGTNLLTISAPSTLDNLSGASLTLSRTPMNWDADFGFVGSASLSLGTGPVTMAANRTLTVSNGTLTVGGAIGGTGSLTKAGAGQLSLSAANAYTGSTTNLAGVLAVNGTATFGDGTAPLVFAGGNLLDTSSRSGSPLANPVIFNADARIYGNSADTTSPNRYLPFTGGFTFNNGATLYIDNLGVAKTIFNLSLQGGNYTTIDWPVVIGDPNFDTAGALTALNLLNDASTPVQTISSVVSGTGSIIRGASTLNTGGTTILTAQNTFSGGVQLTSGALGLGASSLVADGVVVSGPLGTGTFQLGAQTAEAALTVFAAAGAPVQIDNPVYLNGDTNVVFAGTNDLLFTGPVNSGGVAKTLTVTNELTVTFSGSITNAGASAGGALIKQGGGTLILSGVSTYIGTTTVNEGRLLVAGALYTNTVIANAGGTIGGTGSLGGSLTVNSGAQMYLFKTNAATDTPLTVASNLTLNANLVVVDLGGTTSLAAGAYTLLSYGGVLTGAAATTPVLINGALAAGNVGTIDLSTPNQVNLVVAPGSTTPPGFPANGLAWLPAGGMSLTATGAVGTPYRLWATTNLALGSVTTNWTLIGSGTITTSPFTNVDTDATNYPQRFYLFTTP